MPDDLYKLADEVDAVLTFAAASDHADAFLHEAWLAMGPVMVALRKRNAVQQREAVSPLSETAA